MGYIEEVYRCKENGELEQLKNFIPLPLTWAHEHRVDTFLNPGQNKYLDIGYVTVGTRRVGLDFQFCFETRPFGELTKIEAGTYKVKIVLYSENTKSLPLYLCIRWHGSWKDKYDDMKKELIIVKEDTKEDSFSLFKWAYAQIPFKAQKRPL